MFRNTRQKGSVVAGLAIAGLLLTACAGGGGGQGGSSDTTTSPDVVEVSNDFTFDFDAERAKCEAITETANYLSDLPGPTVTTDGKAMSTSGNVDEVLAAAISAVTTDSVNGFVPLSYWSMLDLRRVINNDKPLNVYDVKAQAQLFRKDPALAKASCIKLVNELEAGSKTAKLVRLTESRALGYWVYKPGYQTAIWVCDRYVPAGGVTLLEWNRSYSEEKDDPVAGDTVIIDPLRRALVTTTCPSDAVEGDIVGENDAPAVQPSPSASASQSAGFTPTPSRSPSASTSGGAGGPNPGNTCGTDCNPDGTTTSPGDGGTTPTTPGSTKPGGGETCTPGDCGGGGTTSPPTTNPPTTHPPTTSPPPTTKPPTTSPPPTTRPPTTPPTDLCPNIPGNQDQQWLDDNGYEVRPENDWCKPIDPGSGGL